jgi:hypothetical protein
VIGGQLGNTASVDTVRTTVTDVSYDEPITMYRRGRKSAAHSSRSWIALCPLPYVNVRLFYRHSKRIRSLRPGIAVEPVADAFNGETAGNLPGSVTAHAIGYDAERA